MNESREAAELKFESLWGSLDTSEKTPSHFRKICEEIIAEYQLEPATEFMDFASGISGYERQAGFDEKFRVGTIIPEQPRRYRLDKRINDGGEGIVFAAHDLADLFEGAGQPKPFGVAIKILVAPPPKELALKEFWRKIELQGFEQHPHLVRVFNCDVHEGHLYLVMEYINNGVRIDEYCNQNSLEVKDRLKYFLELCDVVHFLNKKNCIHRDLKPDNVLVNQELGVKLIDLGVAHVTGSGSYLSALQAGSTVGTINYMAPEQISSKSEVRATTDVYALSVILYELLTGSVPHDLKAYLNKDAKSKDRLEEAGKRLLTEEVPLPMHQRLQKSPEFFAKLSVKDQKEQRRLLQDYRNDLDPIVQRGLQKSEADRYQSVQELADDIRRYLDQKPVAARPAALTFSSLSYRATKACHRNSETLHKAALLFAVFAFVVPGYYWYQANQDKVVAELASREADQIALTEKLEREKEVVKRTQTAAISKLFNGVSLEVRGEWEQGVQEIAQAWLTYPKGDRRQRGMLRYLFDRSTQSGTLLNPIPIVTSAPIGMHYDQPVVFNADSSRLLIQTHGQGGGWSLWSTATSRLITELSSYPDAAEFFFSPDGETIVGFSEAEAETVISEYSSVSGQPRKSAFSTFEKAVHIAFSDDGASHYIMAKFGNDYQVLDRLSGRIIGKRSLSEGFPQVKVNREGTRLVTVSKAGRCTLWQLSEGNTVDLTGAEERGVEGQSVRMSADSKRLATIRSLPGTKDSAETESDQPLPAEVVLWDLENGQEVSTWRHTIQEGESAVPLAIFDCFFTSDKKEVLSYGSDRVIQRRRADTGELVDSVSIESLKLGSDLPLHFGLSSNPLVVRMYAGGWSVYVNTSHVPPQMSKDLITFPPLIGPSNDREIQQHVANKWVICRAADGSEISRVPWYHFETGRFSPDGGLFARYRKGDVDLWRLIEADYQTAQADELVIHGASTSQRDTSSDHGLTFSPDATFLAFWTDNRLYIANLAERPTLSGGLMTEWISLGDHQIVEFTDKERRRIDCKSMKTLQRVEHSRVLHPLDAHHGRILATDLEKHCILLNAETLHEIGTFGKTWSSRKQASHLSSNGEYIWGFTDQEGSFDSIKVWNARNGKLSCQLDVTQTAGLDELYWESVEFAGNNTCLLASDTSGRFSLWSLPSGEVVCSDLTKCPEDTQRSVQLSSDSNWFVRIEESSYSVSMKRTSVKTGDSGPKVLIHGDRFEVNSLGQSVSWVWTEDSRYLLTGAESTATDSTTNERLRSLRVTDLGTGRAHETSLNGPLGELVLYAAGTHRAGEALFAVISEADDQQLLKSFSLDSNEVKLHALQDNESAVAVYFSSDGQRIHTIISGQSGELEWDAKTLEPIAIDGTVAKSDGVFAEKFPLNFRPLEFDDLTTPDRFRRLSDLDFGLVVDWKTSFAPPFSLLPTSLGREEEGLFGWSAGPEVFAPNWAFPPPHSDELIRSVVTLISQIPTLSKQEFLNAEQSGEFEAEIRSWKDEWDKLLKSEEGPGWLDQLESTFQEQSWYRSRAFAERSLWHYDWRSAVFHLQHCLIKNRQDVDSKMDLMKAYSVLGEFESALSLLEQIQTEDKMDELLEMRAYLMLAMERDEAFNKMIEEKSDVPELISLKEFRQGKPDEVAKRIDQLKDRSIDLLESRSSASLVRIEEWLVTALALHRLGRLEEGRTVLKRAAEELSHEDSEALIPGSTGFDVWQQRVLLKYLLRQAEERLKMP